MRTRTTYLVSALTAGVLSATFIATDATAGHKHGPGYGRQYVDVYIDAGRNPKLERAIAAYLAEYNPYINIVYSPYYADVKVIVNGYLSPLEIYDRPYGRKRGGYASMGYNYKVKVRAGGRVIYKDRIYGEVTKPLRPRSGYHYNSGKGKKVDKALQAFGLFADLASDGKIHHRYGGYGYGRPRYQPNYYGLERELRREAFRRVAEYVGHIRIPNRYGKYRY